MILFSQTPCAFVGVLEAVRFVGCCETDAAAGEWVRASRCPRIRARSESLASYSIYCMQRVQYFCIRLRLGPRELAGRLHCIPKIAQDGGRWD